MEKSAQPVSEAPAEEEFHPDTAEGDEEDKGEETDGLEVEAIDVPVSIGMSSKLAVHTGPKEREGWWNGHISCYAFVQDFHYFQHLQYSNLTHTHTHTLVYL